MANFCSTRLEDQRCALWSNTYIKSARDPHTTYAAMDAAIETYCSGHPNDSKCACWLFQKQLYNSMYGKDERGGIVPASCVALGPGGNNPCTKPGYEPILLTKLSGGACTANIRNCIQKVGNLTGLGSENVNFSCELGGGSSLNPVAGGGSGSGSSSSTQAQIIKGVDNKVLYIAGGIFGFMFLLVVLKRFL
eukprot:tig00021339_g20382.t1